jgi:large subunit ribosomal protein L10
MPRADKVQTVADIKDRLETANAVFLAEYAGLSVKDQQTLRRSLRNGGAEFKVVKMTLARRATKQLEIDTLDDLLLGPTGLAFANADAAVAAKVLRDFAKDHEVFRIKGGLLGRDFLTPERVADLANIEPREVLLSRIAGALKAPMSKFARLLSALPGGLASAMQQLIDKMGTGEPEGSTDESAGSDDRAPYQPIEPDASDSDTTVQSTASQEIVPSEEDVAGTMDAVTASDAADSGDSPESATEDLGAGLNEPVGEASPAAGDSAEEAATAGDLAVSEDAGTIGNAEVTEDGSAGEQAHAAEDAAATTDAGSVEDAAVAAGAGYGDAATSEGVDAASQDLVDAPGELIDNDEPAEKA